MYRIGFWIVIRNHNGAVGAGTVFILGAHLEEVTLFHLTHEFQRQFHVFLFAELSIVAKRGRLVERIPFRGGDVLPRQAIAVRLAFRRRKVVGNHQRGVRIFRHAEIVTILPEKIHGKVFAHVNVLCVVGTLCTSSRLLILLLAQCDDPIDEIIPWRVFGRFFFHRGVIRDLFHRRRIRDLLPVRRQNDIFHNAPVLIFCLLRYRRANAQQ